MRINNTDSQMEAEKNDFPTTVLVSEHAPSLFADSGICILLTYYNPKSTWFGVYITVASE